jgi:hypothetical protein
MKTVMKFAIVIIASIMLIGCTQNERVKSFGGTGTLELDKGQKLVNVTWKETELWVLTKKMNENDVPEIYIFKEHSNFGMLQGTYIIKETK